jgi:hypothetical protein
MTMAGRRRCRQCPETLVRLRFGECARQLQHPHRGQILALLIGDAQLRRCDELSAALDLLRLPPGTRSSQRHWQIASDEFVYVVRGEFDLITGAGKATLPVGNAAGLKAGSRRASPTEPHHVGSTGPRVGTWLLCHIRHQAGERRHPMTASGAQYTSQMPGPTHLARAKRPVELPRGRSRAGKAQRQCGCYGDEPPDRTSVRRGWSRPPRSRCLGRR